ncbi:MAG: hypothetical protein M1820_005803 [Bogoriella megaspora]|nr:MAG: hypothetical protein M1820_005803 [Bogoriella megaspora]
MGIWPSLFVKVPPIKLAVICMILFWGFVALWNQGTVTKELRSKYKSLSPKPVPKSQKPILSETQLANFHSHTSTGSSNLTFVHRLLDLPHRFDYQCRVIQTQQVSHLARSRMQNVDGRMFQEPTKIQGVEAEFAALPNCPSSEITVPEFERNTDVDTSSLLFGAATSLDRINASAAHWARWLQGTDAGAIVIVHWDPEIDKEIRTVEEYRASQKWKEVEENLEKHGLNVTLIPYMGFGEDSHAYDDPDTKRHLSIAQAMYEMKQPQHQWFVIIDDDTFFVSIPGLLDALAPYDPRKPHFIGQLSESRLHNKYATYMAYGGAGVFLTEPILQRINDHYENCINRIRDDETDDREPGGDMLLKFCVEEYDGTTDVELELLPGLHQLDIKGDPWGFYESGPTDLLTLHHYNSEAWGVFPVLGASYVSDICGDCFLQRYRFNDHTVLTAGASIVRYLNGMDYIDFNRMERTFPVSDEDEFHDSFGPLRKPLAEGIAKRSWRFETAVRSSDGFVRQFYVSRANYAEGIAGHVDSVYELVFKDQDQDMSLAYE